MTGRIFTFVVCAAFSSVLHAGDWPQILGPNRDGIADGEKLLDSWPKAGPDVVWTAKVGQGFAGVAVRDQVMTLFHRLDNSEVVESRHAASGEKIWAREFPTRYRSGMSSDSGPRCVPLVTADRIIVFGVEGHLRCLDRKTGKQIWERDTWKDFSAPDGYFGAGSTPLLADDRVLVNVGGRDDAAIVAFSIKDGETLWQCFGDTASYSSPILADIQGQHHAIFVTRLNTVSVNPADGSILFQFPFGERGPTVNGATPVLMDNSLFVSSSYRIGSVRATINDGKPDLADSGEKLLATQYATPIKYEGLLFAVDGRQDEGSASLKCIDLAMQRVLWTKDGFDYGTLVRIENELLFLTCEGELIRFAADIADYRETHRSHVLESTSRGYRLPAVSNGHLFVRDDDQLKCLKIGE